MADNVGRRNVLKGIGGFALAGATGIKLGRAVAAVALDNQVSVIPAVANRTMSLSDVSGYAQKSVAVGDTIDFRISSPVPYELSIKRLGWNTDEPSALDWPMQSFPQAAASPRSIYPGSYIRWPLPVNMLG